MAEHKLVPKNDLNSSAVEEKLNSHNLVIVTNHKMKVSTRIPFILILPTAISNKPQVSVTEYNKLQAEILQLKKELQVMK